jgi:hypothetical protein
MEHSNIPSATAAAAGHAAPAATPAAASVACAAAGTSPSSKLDVVRVLEALYRQQGTLSLDHLEFLSDLYKFEMQLTSVHKQACQLAADRKLINQQLQAHYEQAQAGPAVTADSAPPGPAAGPAAETATVGAPQLCTSNKEAAAAQTVSSRQKQGHQGTHSTAACTENTPSEVQVLLSRVSEVWKQRGLLKQEAACCTAELKFVDEQVALLQQQQ